MIAALARNATLAGLMLLAGGCGHKTTYASGCGALPAGWITPRQGRGALTMPNVASVAADGSIVWNGRPISTHELAQYLKDAAKLNPVPVTQVKFAAGLDCDVVSNIRRLIVQTADCDNRKCAEGSGKWWRIGDVGPPFTAYDPDDSPVPHTKE